MSASGYFDGAIGGSAGSAAATLSILRAVSSFHFPNWPTSLRDLPGTFLIESPNRKWLIVALTVLVGALCWMSGLYLASRAKFRHSETENRFRALVESLLDTIFVLKDEKVVYINPAGVKMLRAEREEQLIGKSISEIFHPDSIETARRRFREALRAGRTTPPKEYTLVALDGTSVEIEKTSVALTWKGSPAIGVIARDIRGRSETQARLKEYEQAVEGLQEMMIVVDSNYRYLIANRAFLSYRGQTREQLIGRTVAEILNPQAYETVVKNKLAECFTGKVVKYEMKYTYPQIGERDLLIAYYPISDGKEVNRIAGVIQDISERKQAEKALADSQAEVSRVTRALTIGELTTSIAHEINQPITATITDVSASLRWLAQDPPDLREARSALVAAIREANRASSVIAGIRAQLQNTPPTLQRQDIALLILDVLAMLRSELQETQIDVKTELTVNTPRALADRILLQQVLWNLVMNAIDSMMMIHDRPRELRVRLSKHSEGVLVQIQDNGVGLDPAKVDRIFESFFSTKSHGIGMGLAISRSIVETHGGRIWATANFPYGAVFQFTLREARE